ncbi:MAG: response regulator [Desulfobacterales bacterium]|nr:response regulator [Desulfobacterales bacterium]MBF0397573.1 response regulator [Desulfobacterales bacterium]
MEATRAFNILLVEDNPDDLFITKAAFLESKLFEKKIYVVEDGTEAIQYLKKEGAYRDVPKPHLILLDLNLPQISGLSVLETIKQDIDLQSIPVIILTTSTSEVEISNAYMLHANCYINKCMSFDKFVENIKILEQFWFSVVKLP